MVLYSSHSKNSDQLSAVLMEVVLHQYSISLPFLVIPVTKCSLFCTNQVDHLLKVLTTARNFCIFPVVVKMIIDINVMDPISECGYGSQKKT
uniref:Uncharacterized protein n=1 Tax=Vitis vinifera TaxID=29760 RepID=F6HPU2_VITVI